MAALGIDVSWNNGTVDWQAVKDAGVKFAIVRSSYGQNSVDETFLTNVNGAHSVGLKCGAYHYDYSMTVEDAIQNARNCKKAIEDAGVLLELPVFYDMEDADHWKRKRGFNFSYDHVTNMCMAFLKEIKPLDCGIYASYSWFEDYIDWRGLGCAVWNAQWVNASGISSNPDINRDYIQGYMWQFTDSYEIGGKLFDANIMYGME